MMKTWDGITFAENLAKSRFENNRTNRRLLWRCALAAICLILCVYPDVIFLKASLSTASLVNVTVDDGHERVQLVPEREGREAHDGFYDVGGGAFQSEPGAQFVRRSLQGGQSI